MNDKKLPGTVLYQNVTSNYQSGGITAHTVNVGPQPRVLVDDLTKPLLNQVPKSKPVNVTAVLGDGEAMSFATAITAFLRASGYNVSGVNQSIFTTVVTGTVVTLEADKTEIVVGTHLPN